MTKPNSQPASTALVAIGRRSAGRGGSRWAAWLTAVACAAGCGSGVAPPNADWTPDRLRDRLQQAPTPVLVGFIAAAGPERDQAAEPGKLRQTLHALEPAAAGRLEMLRVDLSAAPWAREAYRIGAADTLVLFHEGRELDRYLGSMRPGEVEEWLAEKLGQLPASATGAGDSDPVEELHLTEETFDQKLAEIPRPVLVDFWAPWCGPCLKVAPHLQAIGREERRRLTIAKVNVDEQPELARRYVRGGIPLLVLFHQGEVVDALVGAPPPDRLSRWVTERLDRLVP